MLGVDETFCDACNHQCIARTSTFDKYWLAVNVNYINNLLVSFQIIIFTLQELVSYIVLFLVIIYTLLHLINFNLHPSTSVGARVHA